MSKARRILAPCADHFAPVPTTLCAKKFFVVQASARTTIAKKFVAIANPFLTVSFY
jgi:hypothetical protein